MRSRSSTSWGRLSCARCPSGRRGSGGQEIKPRSRTLPARSPGRWPLPRRRRKRLAATYCTTPGRGTDVEVEVLRGLGHRDPREPQGGGREADAEGSGERNCGPTDRNRIAGDADQGERARDREALVTKGRRRRSGGRAGKASALIRGDLASCLKERRSA